MTQTIASDAEIADLVVAVESDDRGDVAKVEALIQNYPEDPRLHFMLGSILAGKGQAIEAHQSMSRALEIAPAFALARYQLGFFELTSGEAQRALSTWGPLLAAPRDNYLRVFVEGMTHLIRDEFDEAIERFEMGVKLNDENPPMNRDIRMLIDECRNLTRRGEDEGELSATSLLLNRFGGSSTLQ